MHAVAHHERDDGGEPESTIAFAEEGVHVVAAVARADEVGFAKTSG